MRKAIFGAVIGALVFAVAAWAATQNNTVAYKSTVKYKGKPSAKKPKNVLYNGILHVGTQENTQPNTAPVTDVYFARQLKNNSTHFKSCKSSDIDGKGQIPSKCNKAQVGDGTASALVGKPGQPEGSDPFAGQSLRASLKVKAFNGPKGKSILLAVNGSGTGNVWRVINGPIKKIKKGKFGYKVGFHVPKDLQEQLGSQIALTDFDVKIRTKRTATVKKHKVSYLQITKCPKSKKLPTRATVHFNQDDGSTRDGSKTSNGTMSCH